MGSRNSESPSLKTRYSQTYQLFLARLREARLAAGMTQQQVADALQKPQSFVAKAESGERRIDLVEFLVLSRILSIDPAAFVHELAADAMPLTPSRAKKKN